MSQFNDTVTKTQKWVKLHSPEILVATGVIGSVSTVYLGSRAGTRAAAALEKARFESDDELTKVDEVKVAWKYYVPPTLASATTIFSILTLYKVSADRAAAAAAVLATTQQGLTAYQDKVRELLGEEKEQEIREKIVEDEIEKNPPADNLILINDDQVLIHDRYSGRYFRGSVEEIKSAVNAVNREVNRMGYATLSDFYDLIGIGTGNHSDNVGWSANDELFDVHFTAAMGPHNKPVLDMVFTVTPVSNFIAPW